MTNCRDDNFEHLEHSAPAVQRATEREWKPTSIQITLGWKIEKESRKKRTAKRLFMTNVTGLLLSSGVFSWSSLNTVVLSFRKRSSELKFGGIFFQTLLIVTLVTYRRFAVSFPLPSYCLLRFTTFKIKSLAFIFSRKITICIIFCLFLNTMSATDGTWHMSVFLCCCLFVCLFFLLSPK